MMEGPQSVEARECSREWVVGEEHLARHLAERGRRVLSTPCMVLMMEATARECLERILGDGRTSVGYRVDVKHRKPVEEGERILVTARLIEFDGRRALFYIRAEKGGDLVGEAFHERFVTD